MSAEIALKIGAAVGRYFTQAATGVRRVVIGRTRAFRAIGFENALTAG